MTTSLFAFAAPCLWICVDNISFERRFLQGINLSLHICPPGTHQYTFTPSIPYLPTTPSTFTFISYPPQKYLTTHDCTSTFPSITRTISSFICLLIHWCIYTHIHEYLTIHILSFTLIILEPFLPWSSTAIPMQTQEDNGRQTLTLSDPTHTPPPSIPSLTFIPTLHQTLLSVLHLYSPQPDYFSEMHLQPIFFWP